MWKVLNKEVDLGEPTPFLDHVYLGCTQRQCKISKNTVDNYRTMFESRISAGGTEKLPFPQNLRISSSCLCTWTTSKWQDRNQIWIQCGKYSRKNLSWENQHHSLTMFIWVALQENVKEAKMLWTITEICLNPRISAGGMKFCLVQRNVKQTFPHGPMTWKVMQKMRGKILRTGEQNDSTNTQSRNSMP